MALQSSNTADVDEKPWLTPSVKGWKARDLNDVGRLGAIIGDFLGTEPYRSDTSFSESVTRHLRGSKVPFGAVRRLRYLMDSLMVKHRYVPLSHPPFR